MFTVTKYPHGTFSWADVNSSDWAAGKQFYSDLMGWETEDLPMGEDTFYTFHLLWEKEREDRGGNVSDKSFVVPGGVSRRDSR